jgi:hypothetical protein
MLGISKSRLADMVALVRNYQGEEDLVLAQITVDDLSTLATSPNASAM